MRKLSQSGEDQPAGTQQRSKARISGPGEGPVSSCEQAGSRPDDSPEGEGVAAGRDPGRFEPLRLADLLDDVDDVSSLPHIAMQVIEVVNQPDSSAIDLLHVVESDPALSARILKVVNSAACGLRVRVTNLHHAICLLGQKQVRNLAVTLSVSAIFKCGGTIGNYSRPELWRHLVSTAVASRLVAARSGVEAFDEAFLAGLLHDIGIILEDQWCHDHFVNAIGLIDGRAELRVVERRAIGFDHSSFGAAIAERWRFPRVVTDTIRFHHTFSHYTGPHADVVAAVEVANCLCTLKGRSSVGSSLLRPPIDSMRHLSLDRQGLNILAADLTEEFDRQRTLFEIGEVAA
ncbi:MAG: HDOD domain-containing protein [Planctomycetota bacterium]